MKKKNSCSLTHVFPYIHADQTERIDEGRYSIEVDEFSLTDTDACIHININGQTSCQIVSTTNGTNPPRIDTDYP